MKNEGHVTASAGSGSRRSLALALAAAAVPLASLGAGRVDAALLYWDPTNGTVAGTGAAVATGNWGTATSSWGDAAGTAAPAAWNNAGGDTAVFAAGNDATGAYTVTVNTPITVAGVTREEGTPTISGVAANAITFVGNTLALDTGTGTLVMSAIFAANPSGLVTKTGTGIASFGTNQTLYNGKWLGNQGSLSMGADGRFGVTPGAVVADQLTLNGGNLRTSTANTVFNANRGITLGANGGGFDQTVTMTWGGPITGSAGGAMKIASTGTTILTNTANNYDGITQWTSTGTLQVGAAGVIPDTSTLTFNSAGTFNLNGFNETVKSISSTVTGSTVAVGTATLTVNNPAGEVTSSLLTASAGGKVIKNGAGAWTLSGSSTGFQGEFVLNSGTVGVGAPNIFGNAGTATLTIAGGNLANNSASGRTLPSALTVNLSGDFSVDDSLNAGPGQINLTGPITIRNSDRIITVNGLGNLALGGVVGEDVAGRSLTKAGAGILAFPNPTTAYTGTTTLQAGTIQVDGDGAIGSGTFNLSGGTYNASANRTVTTPNAINLTANTFITTTSNATTAVMDLGGALGGSGGTLTFRNNGADNGGDVFSARLSGSGYTFSRPIVVDNGSIGLTKLTGFNPNGTSQTLAGDISGNGGFSRSASAAGLAGETVLSGNNSFSGPTEVIRGILNLASASGAALGGTSAVSIDADGILLLSFADQINNAANMTLNAGTFNTGGVSETLGALALLDTSILDMGAAASIVQFADSSIETWTAADTLRIFNWSGNPVTGGGTDQVHVGTNPSGGLTATQLLQVQFYSDNGLTPIGSGAQYVGTSGEIVPVPEPTAVALLGLGGLALGARRRRRLS